MVIFLIWGLVSVGLFAWQEKYQERIKGRVAKKERLRPKELRLPQPFQFDEPTEEELTIIKEENDDRIPLVGSLDVFECPKDDCEILGQYQAGDELVFDSAQADPAAEWLPVLWDDPLTIPATGYVKITDLEKVYQAQPPTPETSLDIEELDLDPADPVPLHPQTIVGIVCDFKNYDTGEEKTTRGSGVIVTEDGHILTARSIVDLNYLNEGFEDYQLKSCLVGQLPGNQPLPSIEAIKKINAFVRIPFLPYTAEATYIPADAGLSDYEKAWLDFSVLQINGLNPDAPFFGVTKLPEKFPSAPILISDLPKTDEPILSFGFPSGTTIGQGADIKTLFIQGLLSHIDNYWAGDERFKDDLFMIESQLDTEDTAGGRFGSPIFWKGYVIGIHTVKQRQSLQIFNVAIKPVLEKLFDDNVAISLEVY